MKNLLLIIICFALSQAQGQVRTGGDAEFLMVINNENTVDKPVGSPYFPGEQFTLGTVKMEQRDPLIALLRYDVAQEVMEIKLRDNDSEVMKLVNNDRVIYEIGEREFVWNSLNVDGTVHTGFFVKYFDGNSIKLLGKPVAKLTEAVKATTGYGLNKPARIEIEELFLLVFNDGRVEEISLKERDLKKAFDSDKVNSFLKENKIKSVEDVVELLTSYEDSLN